MKRLIARFKAWRNDTWGDSNNGRPKSYLLSLLVVIAYYRAPDDLKHAKKIEKTGFMVCISFADQIVHQWQECLFHTLFFCAQRVTEEVKSLVKVIHQDKDIKYVFTY